MGSGNGAPIFLGHLGGCDSDTLGSALLIAVVVVIVVILIACTCRSRGENHVSGKPSAKLKPRPKSKHEGFCKAEAPIKTFDHPEWDSANTLFPTDVNPDAMWTPNAATAGLADAEVEALNSGGNRPHRDSVYEGLARMYSTADVDPMITGQAFEYRDNTRPIYDQRSSHGGVWGMQEFSSSGNPGDVGVDVGPTGLAEYEGSVHGYDDGIPEQWRMPSTPIRWYKPRQRDYYGPEGPTPWADGLYLLDTPDHDPLVGMDEGPDY
jgi:hypothetical protein